MSSPFKTILDPGNFAGKRDDGEMSYAGMLDPGGEIIKGTTGSDIGRKIADPGKLMEDKSTAPVVAPIVTTLADKRARTSSYLFNKSNASYRGGTSSYSGTSLLK